MKTLRIALLFLLITFMTSCGGGNGNPLPFVRDMSGLEGAWIVSLNESGILNLDAGGSMQVSIDIPLNVVIGTNSFRVEDDPLDWTYDGTTLIIDSDYENEYWDPTLGNVWEEGHVVLSISIQPGDTSAVFSGNAEAWIESDNFGIMSGPLTYTGIMDKQ